MQKFFFDMKDGVPHRDTVGIEFKTNAEAIGHCKEIAQHFRDESLRDDQDLEISVVNSLGREIHREFVHREQGRLSWGPLPFSSQTHDVAWWAFQGVGKLH